MTDEIQIYDDYLASQELDNLQNLFFNNTDFPYFFNNHKVDQGDGFSQFTHQFYINNTINSNFYNYLSCILDKIDPLAIIGIKANLQMKTKEIKTTPMHQDYANTLDNQKTGIFYVNTNNGKTVFDDGQEISSVANRLIIFPAKKYHAGTTHTDVDYRCVINLNWF